MDLRLKQLNLLGVWDPLLKQQDLLLLLLVLKLLNMVLSKLL